MTIHGGDYLKGGLYTGGGGGEVIIYKGVLYMGVYGSLLRSMKMYYFTLIVIFSSFMKTGSNGKLHPHKFSIIQLFFNYSTFF